MDLQSIFSIELINYLNKFINHENLYEVYSNDSKIENLNLNSTMLRPQHRENKQDL